MQKMQERFSVRQPPDTENVMNNENAGFSPTRRIKRADPIVDSIKRWVVVNGRQSGDRLPNGRELMEQFDCAKGTVREALKLLVEPEIAALVTPLLSDQDLIRDLALLYQATGGAGLPGRKFSRPESRRRQRRHTVYFGFRDATNARHFAGLNFDRR
jgi:hypothetical protein